jgi:hypothetical protein
MPSISAGVHAYNAERSISTLARSELKRWRLLSPTRNSKRLRVNMMNSGTNTHRILSRSFSFGVHGSARL